MPKLRFGPSARRGVLIGAAAYAMSLVVIMPAGVMLDGASGTIWSGSAALPAAHRLDWRWSPLRSLTRLGFAVVWDVTSADSALSGQAVLRPGKIIVDRAQGALDLALPLSQASDIPFTCAVLGRLDLASAELGGAASSVEGAMRTAAGSCRIKGRDSVDQTVPPMFLQLTRLAEGGSGIRLMTDEASPRALMTGTMGADAVLHYSLTPAGVKMLPFAAPPGGAGEVVEVGF